MNMTATEPHASLFCGTFSNSAYVWSIIKVEFDVRETARPNNRVGKDDPRLPYVDGMADVDQPSDDWKARNKLLVWVGNGSTVDFDVIKPPGNTSPFWCQVEKYDGTIVDFCQLTSSTKSYTLPPHPLRSNFDYIVKYGIDADGSLDLSGTEVAAGDVYEIYGITDGEHALAWAYLNAAPRVRPC